MAEGGLGGGESARITTLESQSARLDARLGQVETRLDRADVKLDNVLDRLARLEERVSHLPTKEVVVKMILGGLAVVTAITVFQGKIQALLGLAR